MKHLTKFKIIGIILLVAVAILGWFGSVDLARFAKANPNTQVTFYIPLEWLIALVLLIFAMVLLMKHKTASKSDK
jgi:hypothetical protein